MSSTPTDKAKGDEAKSNWKHRLAQEFVSYWINFSYLPVFFGAFTSYRRIVLAEYQISYLHYGIAVIESLILAKVILLGDALGLGGNVKSKPLIYPTLRKAFVFSVF